MNDAELSRLRAQVSLLMKKKRNHINELCKWALEIHPDAAAVQDSCGVMPVQTALLRKMTWHQGLDRFVNSAPDWPVEKDTKTGLYPFLTAASFADADLSTVYKLLHYIPHVVTAEGADKDPEDKKSEAITLRDIKRLRAHSSLTHVVSAGYQQCNAPLADLKYS